MIYLVEDDDSIRELVIYTLRSTGMEAKGFGLPSAFWRAMAEETPELVLLDIMLPELDGWQVCREIRQNSKVPIIMLTAKSEERDELLGFELGVDEYISKPFSPKILVARVEAILRRSGKTGEDDVLEAGGIRIDKAAHMASIDGKPMELSYKEFELLTYFLENQGIALSREKILNNGWNGEREIEKTVELRLLRRRTHHRHPRQKTPQQNGRQRRFNQDHLGHGL